MYWDATILILLPAILLSALAQSAVRSAFQKYSKVRSFSGVTADQAVQRLLALGTRDKNGSRFTVAPINGQLTDHYNPKTGVIGLSQGVYGSDSLAALGIAAHETGHALQDDSGYLPIRLHRAIVPAANFASQAAFPLILIGLLLRSDLAITLGIVLYTAVVAYYLITLPVEFNASSRALKLLTDNQIITQEEKPMVRRVLSAAALTYVAAALTAVLQLVRLLAITNRRRS